MPKFHEIFGKTILNTDIKYKLIDGLCPMSNTICDGGGNRHQTKLNNNDLNKLFPTNTIVNGKIPAICSIDYDKLNQQWIVCPRRIFSFPKNSDKKVNLHPIIKNHEEKIISLLGFSKNTKIGIYPEVYLKFSDDDTDINYHFDYILCEIIEDKVTLSELWDLLSIKENNKKNYYKKLLRENGLIQPRATDASVIKYFPNLENMAIIEVMTASTSGSNTERGTDIKSSYLNAIQNKLYECPGINKRQVWGRMATQLFAKSSLAESWNTKTYWVVQDELINNICRTTKLKIDDTENKNSLINFISLSYSDSNNLIISKNISIDSGVNFSGTNTCVDILLPKKTPSKLDLLSCILRTQLSNIINI